MWFICRMIAFTVTHQSLWPKLEFHKIYKIPIIPTEKTRRNTIINKYLAPLRRHSYHPIFASIIKFTIRNIIILYSLAIAIASCVSFCETQFLWNFSIKMQHNFNKQLISMCTDRFSHTFLCFVHKNSLWNICRKLFQANAEQITRATFMTFAQKEVFSQVVWFARRHPHMKGWQYARHSSVCFTKISAFSMDNHALLVADTWKLFQVLTLFWIFFDNKFFLHFIWRINIFLSMFIEI